MSMGKDPASSVVDAFGRTHDHENLFICGTGVMPTAATMNSTLTAIALALRTAEHILPAESTRAATTAGDREASPA